MDFEKASELDFTDDDSLDDTLRKLTELLDSMEHPESPKAESESVPSESSQKEPILIHKKDLTTLINWKPPAEDNEPDEVPFLLQNRKLAFAIILALILAASVVLFLGGKLLKKSESAKIRSGISVSGIDVGRLSYPEEAVPLVADILDNRYWEEKMVVVLEGERLEWIPEVLQPTIHIEGLVEEAYQKSLEDPDSEEPYDVPLAPYLTINADPIRSVLEEHEELFSAVYHPSRYYLEGAAPDLTEADFASQPKQTLVLETGESGSVLDLETVYNQILNAYCHGNFYLEISSSGEKETPEKLDLDAIWQEVNIAAQDMTIDPETYALSTGAWGCSFDLEDSKAQLAQAQEGDILRIPLVYTPPQLAQGSAVFHDCRGQAVLPLADTPSDTLRLLCRKLNGVVLDNTDSLSLLELFDGVLTQQDCSNGTKEDESGCILASALWQASLCAEMDISNVMHHNFAPAFCEPGMDIMLRPASEEAGALPPLDLSIQNNTRNPIMILAECSEDELTVQIYGTETREYTVTLESEVHPKQDPGTVYQDVEESAGIPDGTVLQEGHGSSVVDVNRCRYRISNGELISKVFGAYVQYPGCQEIIAQIPEA